MRCRSVARKGKSEDAVSFETKTFTLKISRALTQDVVAFMHVHKIYANRADFILYAIRWFNHCTLRFLMEQKSKKNMSDSRIEENILTVKEKIVAEMDSYIDYKEKNRFTDSVTFRITDGFRQYCSLLNDDSWRFESVQDYMRAAIAWRIKKLRDDRTKVRRLSSKLSKDLFTFVCPSNISRGQDAFDEDEMVIDDLDDSDSSEHGGFGYDDSMVDMESSDDKNANDV